MGEPDPTGREPNLSGLIGTAGPKIEFRAFSRKGRTNFTFLASCFRHQAAAERNLFAVLWRTHPTFPGPHLFHFSSQQPSTDRPNRTKKHDFRPGRIPRRGQFFFMSPSFSSLRRNACAIGDPDSDLGWPSSGAASLLLAFVRPSARDQSWRQLRIRSAFILFYI